MYTAIEKTVQDLALTSLRILWSPTSLHTPFPRWPAISVHPIHHVMLAQLTVRFSEEALCRHCYHHHHIWVRSPVCFPFKEEHSPYCNTYVSPMFDTPARLQPPCGWNPSAFVASSSVFNMVNASHTR